ncbi:MAG: STAS domain-containing protein [Caldilineaceae bacterium]
MNFHSRSINNITLLDLSGRVDITNSRALKHKLTQISGQHPTNVVVNLANVSFMDSSGLAVLVQSMRRCREYGGDLLLCNPQKPVRMIFELTRLDKAIQIFDTEREAVARFQTGHRPLANGAQL